MVTKSNAMTFEDYLRTRLEARAHVQMTIGRVADGSAASFFTWDNKLSGTYFWNVSGDAVTLINFVSTDPET
jgi:hypothetical protein